MYIVLLYSTYGYLCISISSKCTYGFLRTSISSVTPMGDLNKYKYKFCSTYGYFRISISWVTPTRDLYKYAISTSMCISLLYEFRINYDICY